MKTEYDLNEAAGLLLGLSASALRAKIHRKEIPGIQIPYGEKRYKLGVSAETLAGLLGDSAGGEYEAVFEQYLSELVNATISKRPASPNYIAQNRDFMRLFWRNIGKDRDRHLRHITAEQLKTSLQSYKTDEQARRDYFAVRENIYKTITGFMRLLVRDGHQPADELVKMKLLKPKPRFALKKDVI